MNIRGKRILLRAIEPDDLERLHGWSNDPDLAPGLGDIHFPSSTYAQVQWYERTQKTEQTVRLSIIDAEGSHIGMTGFWGINWRDRRAEHATLIGDPSARGKGYGKEAIATCARYAFEEMDLFRLDATIVKANEASLKVYTGCGFVVEGTQRAHALRAGKRLDRVMLGLLAEEYRAWAAETGYWDAG